MFFKIGVLTNFAIFCVGVSFYLTLLQRDSGCFPVNFAKFLRKSSFIEHLWWLLLTCEKNLTAHQFFHHFSRFHFVFTAAFSLLSGFSSGGSNTLFMMARSNTKVVLLKNVSLKVLRNSPEILFSNKVGLWRRRLPVNNAKFFRTTFL